MIAIQPPATDVERVHKDNGLDILYGRGINNLSRDYRLPADEPEMDRLSLQHIVNRLILGGLVPKDLHGQLEQLLLPRGNRVPLVLDLGSGSGAWATEFAAAHPHAQVVGVDLIKTRPRSVPSNCRFEVADVLKGLPQYVGQADFIHCRHIVGHMTDPMSFINIAASCLAPGGVLLLVDIHPLMFGPDKTPIEPAREGEDNMNKSWFARLFHEKNKQAPFFGQMPPSGHEHLQRLHDSGKFTDEANTIYYAPISWDGENIPNGPEIGRLNRINVIELVKSYAPFLIDGGLSEEEVDMLVQNTHEETLAGDKHIYAQWSGTWGCRRADE